MSNSPTHQSSAHTANYLPASELPESIGYLKKGNQLAIKIMKA
jgi:hypothetical protein